MIYRVRSNDDADRGAVVDLICADTIDEALTLVANLRRDFPDLEYPSAVTLTPVVPGGIGAKTA